MSQTAAEDAEIVINFFKSESLNFLPPSRIEVALDAALRLRGRIEAIEVAALTTTPPDKEHSEFVKTILTILKDA